MVEFNAELFAQKPIVCEDEEQCSEEYAAACNEVQAEVQDNLFEIVRMDPNPPNDELNEESFFLRRQCVYLELKSIGWSTKLTGLQMRNLVHACQENACVSLEELGVVCANREDLRSLTAGAANARILGNPEISAVMYLGKALKETEKVRKAGKRVPHRKINFKANLVLYHMDHLDKSLLPKYPEFTDKVMLKQEDTKCVFPEFDIKLPPFAEEDLRPGSNKGGKNNFNEATLEEVANQMDTALGTNDGVNAGTAIQNAAIKKAAEVAKSNLPCAQYLVAARLFLGTHAVVGSFGTLGYKVVECYIGLLERMAAKHGVPTMTAYDVKLRKKLANTEVTSEVLARSFKAVDRDILNDITNDNTENLNKATREALAEAKKKGQEVDQKLAQVAKRERDHMPRHPPPAAPKAGSVDLFSGPTVARPKKGLGKKGKKGSD